MARSLCEAILLTFSFRIFSGPCVCVCGIEHWEATQGLRRPSLLQCLRCMFIPSNGQSLLNEFFLQTRSARKLHLGIALAFK